MKLVLKIFNFVIIGIAALATVLLFALPTFSLNSLVTLDVDKFSQFVPETAYTKDYDIPTLLGTDEINVNIKFTLYPNGVAQVMNGNKDKINEYIIVGSATDILNTLHEPVDLITDIAIKSTLKSTIKNEIAKQVDEARKKAGSPSTAEEIMDDVGMDDEYFTNFTFALYDGANKETSTVDSVSAILYEQIDGALAKAEETGAVDTSSFAEQQKTTTRNNLLSILNQLEMVKDDGHIEKISDLPYLYFSRFVKKNLSGKVSETELNQKDNESLKDYSDRLICLYIVSEMPDMFYTIIGYVSLGLFIGMFIFAITWLFLLIFTLYRTFFGKKKYTVFGPWFFIAGLLQVVLGLALTITFKFILPSKLDISSMGLPIKAFILAPRTCALATSIIFLVTIGVAIAYFVIRKLTPKEE